MLRFAVSLFLLAIPHHALGWGARGHELVADLAWQELHPLTRQRLQELLDLEPGATLASISLWADQVRTPTTARWHYINIPSNSNCEFEAARDCPQGSCVLGAIRRQSERLANATSLRDRLAALKWVVHLVADAHQPLHAGSANDKGGNLIQLRIGGRGTNLHALWDSGLIENWPGGLTALRQDMESKMAEVQDESEATQWVEESCVIASTSGFKPADQLDTDTYWERWNTTLSLRLAAAAKRLAEVLDRASK